MKITDITVDGPRVVATEDEIDVLEADLGIRLPEGYREFMVVLGEGVLGGTYVRIYPPWRIRRELQGWQNRIREYWFWKGLDKERALAAVVVGDTLDGDELIVHPSDPDEIWVLPRHSERALVAGRGLWEALEWLCSAGVLTEPFAERKFEPFDSRVGHGDEVRHEDLDS